MEKSNWIKIFEASEIAMKKKILFLSPLPPPSYGSALSSQANLEILKKDFEVHSIKLNFAKSMSNIGKIDLSKIRGVIKTSKKIKEEIKSFNPDIIYFVPATYQIGLFRDSHYASIIRKLTSKKIIFHIRSRILEKHWRNPLYKSRYKKMLKNQKAIVLDESLISDLHELISKESIKILSNAIPNAIPETKFKKIVKKRLKQNSFNILFFSNMDKTKGWTILLKVCKILKNKGIKFECNFAGAWPSRKEEKEFKDFVTQNNLKEVKHLGKLSPTERNNLMSKSDILVYPTTLDTFGRVIVEAMMLGLPIIANGIAAITTTIQHGKTGFVLKENSPEEIVSYIEKLQDKKLRKKMGLAGRKRFLKEYEIKKYEKKFLKIINS